MKWMTTTGAAMAAALWIAGPALAQGIDSPYSNEQDSTGLGLEDSSESATGSTQQDILPAPMPGAAQTMTGETQEDILPAPMPGAAQTMTGETQETVVPGTDAGGAEATPQGGEAESMGQPQGSQSTGEFGSPSESGPSLESEADIAETAVPGETQSVTGTVRKIDMKKGMMILKTDDGKSMELHADKAMLQDEQFKKGKKVTAQYQKQGEMNHVTSMAPAEGMGGSMTPPAAEPK